MEIFLGLFTTLQSASDYKALKFVFITYKALKLYNLQSLKICLYYLHEWIEFLMKCINEF